MVGVVRCRRERERWGGDDDDDDDDDDDAPYRIAGRLHSERAEHNTSARVN